jgi:hypothetical protein
MYQFGSFESKLARAEAVLCGKPLRQSKELEYVLERKNTDLTEIDTTAGAGRRHIFLSCQASEHQF